MTEEEEIIPPVFFSFFFLLAFFFEKIYETLKFRVLTSLFPFIHFRRDIIIIGPSCFVVGYNHGRRRRRRSHGHHDGRRRTTTTTTTTTTTEEKNRGEKVERGCRLVVVDVVRFVRDMQKHVARTVDRIPSEQHSRTRRRGRTVHRGAFLSFFLSLFLSLSLFKSDDDKSVVFVVSRSIVSFFVFRVCARFFTMIGSRDDWTRDSKRDLEALKEMTLYYFM